MTITDTTTDTGITRVQYFDRQFLRVEDFVDEQAYHLALQRRHSISSHIWGIVAGLEVSQDKETKISVSRGLAIDGYGRMLIVPVGQTLDKSEFDRKATDVLDVWLLYRRTEPAQTPPGTVDCGPTGTGSAYRVAEDAEIVLRVPDRAFDTTLPDPRNPPGVPAADVPFDATRIPPDDPRRAWPVFLARITRTPGTTPTYVIDTSARPYAGLVGEAIETPSNTARMQLGMAPPQPGAVEPETQLRRFAVFLAPPDHDTLDPSAHPRLEIEADGPIRVRGTTHLYGDLLVDGGAVQFGGGPAYDEPRPWSIYRVSDTSVSSAPPVAPRSELRIEMAKGGNGPNQVSIGSWSEQQKKFVPCLTIADDCTVTVHGNLVVGGTLSAQNVSPAGTLPPPAFSEAAGSAIASAHFSGLVMQLGSAAGQLGRPPGTPSGSMAAGDAGTVATLTGALIQDQNLVPLFTALVRTHPDLARTLVTELSREEPPPAQGG